MKFHATSLFLLCLSFGSVILLHGCGWPSDSGGDQTHPPQTKILNVLVQPDTVAPGDTARFTCIIEDSTDERFRFFWGIDAGEVIGAENQGNNQFVSEENHIRWVAPNEQNFYTLGVFVSNGAEDSAGVRVGFSIVVE